MTTTNIPAAFPTPGRIELRDIPGQGGTKYEHKIPTKDGMTLRDYFAAQIAAGDAAADQGWGNATDATMLQRARLYYRLADAMVIARDEQPETPQQSDHDF